MDVIKLNLCEEWYNEGRKQRTRKRKDKEVTQSSSHFLSSKYCDHKSGTESLGWHICTHGLVQIREMFTVKRTFWRCSAKEELDNYVGTRGQSFGQVHTCATRVDVNENQYDGCVAPIFTYLIIFRSTKVSWDCPVRCRKWGGGGNRSVWETKSMVYYILWI